MATKKESTTKSFVLRLDAATMDALEQLQWIITEALRKNGRLKKSRQTPSEPPKE